MASMLLTRAQLVAMTSPLWKDVLCGGSSGRRTDSASDGSRYRPERTDIVQVDENYGDNSGDNRIVMEQSFLCFHEP